MKLLLQCSIVLLLGFSASAQGPVNGNLGPNPPGMPGLLHVYGKVVDSTGKGISDASVLLLENRLDAVSKKNREILVKGVSTQSNGDFNFEDVVVHGGFTIKVSATSYKPYQQKLGMGSRNNADEKPGNTEKDLGKLTLKADVQQLQEVMVTAVSGRLKMDIDKKVFSVDKNIVSTGGTAVDVMKNVPSVNVDIDGNVSLRNAAPQIFVDGRPTILTLDQIPADAIESVEVMTNPSAKYDASGGGAGILNIVLKKNRKTGYSGNLRAGVDKLGAVNSGFDFNYRQNRINFFGSINYNQRKSNTIGNVSRLNVTDTPQTKVNEGILDRSSGRFVFARAGLDYFITNRTTLSAAVFKANGKFSPYESVDMTTDSLFNSGTKSSFSNRISTGTREFNGRGLSFGLKTVFPKQGEEWTADANYFSGNSVNSSLYTTSNYNDGQNSTLSSTGLQKIIGTGTDYNLILQTDYVNPLSDKTKLETGVRAAVRGRQNYSDNFSFDNASNTYQLIPSVSSNYQSTDNVYAAYASITSAIHNFGYKIGLRAESSDYVGELTDTKQSFHNQYPISFFPSIFLSQKLGSSQEIQASFTRRINRPNFFQLIPFADYSDVLNITQGNPALKPEFTNSFEATYSKNFQKNNTVMASVYYKKTTDLITSYMEPGINPFTGKSVIINTYINANYSQTYGAEFTSQKYVSKWWDMTTDINLYNGKIHSVDSSVVSNAMWSWFAKWNNNFKLPANFIVQLSGSYQSKAQLVPGSGNSGPGGPPGARGGSSSGGGPGGGFGGVQSASQGYIDPYYSFDVALRKNFLKNNAASVILSVNDIFRTRTVTQHSESAYFIQDYSRLRDPQMIRLTVSYRFGKMDATLFKRKNNNTESDSGQIQSQ